MNQIIEAGMRAGSVKIPASKSQAHRLLICAALSKHESVICCDSISKDIQATIDCLNAMGAEIETKASQESLIHIKPIQKLPLESVDLFCNESGSTLRFLTPILGALGISATFHMQGRLSQRPMTELIEQLTKSGMSIKQNEELLTCSGKLNSGSFTLPGNISSQYISGMLFAMPILENESSLEITGKIESKNYIQMTKDALELSKIHYEELQSGYKVPGNQRYNLPQKLTVESDWSNAAFFLCIGALSEKGVLVKGLDLNSNQGDKRILDVLSDFGAVIERNNDHIHVSKGKLIGCEVDASQIPDLVPVISVVASICEGTTRIEKAQRLRIKETDRLQTTTEMLGKLGADIRQTEDGLTIKGKKCLRGAEVDSFRDHRIAMSAAVAASVCENEVTIKNAEAADKSYPRFWNDLRSLEVI